MPPHNPPKLIRDARLDTLSTFRLPARAAELLILDHPDQLRHLPPTEGPELILGAGSNTLFVGDYPGRVILNRLTGVGFHRHGDRVWVTAAAGENWHRLVRRCLESLSAFDRHTGEAVTLANKDCAFAYRDSYFKSTRPGRFLIISITLSLSRRFTPQAGYASLANELARGGIKQPTPRQLTAAVMRLRRHRLPDPARLPNAGSFFKNPIVEAASATALLEEHPGLPHWPMGNGRIKLAAAWMIEQLGWKGRSIGDAGVYRNHALVLVNRGQASVAELRRLIDAITASVEKRFGLRLEPEPLLVGQGSSSTALSHGSPRRSIRNSTR